MNRLSHILSTGVLCALALGPAPADAEPAEARVALDVSLGRPAMKAGRRDRAYLKVGLTGFELPDQRERPPVNLALVVDRSSSMSGAKIDEAKEAAIMVIERLQPHDIVSVVSYDHEVDVLVPATKVRDREVLVQKIRGLFPRGSTALFAGTSRGMEEVRKFLEDDRVNRVILLSDGRANVGPSSPNELGRLGIAARKEGISVTTIGLGLGYNEDLMARLARASDGNHAFVENAEHLAQVFDYELEDVMSVVAQEVTVKVRLADGVRPVRALNRDAEIQGQTVYLKLNQLYATQEKYFLLEVDVPPREPGFEQAIAAVDVSYYNAITAKTDRLSGAARVAFTASAGEVERRENRDVMVAAVEAVAVERNRQAVALRDQGQVDEAERVLKDNIDFLEKKGKKYRSERLERYKASNQSDAKNLRGKDWNKQRKAMRKKQYELDSQQSY